MDGIWGAIREARCMPKFKEARDIESVKNSLVEPSITYRAVRQVNTETIYTYVS